MTTPRNRSIFWSAVLSSVSVATLTFSTPAFAAAKKAKPASVAKKKAADGKTKGSESPKDDSAAKATPASTTWEAPPRDAVENTPPAAPAPAPEAKPVAAPEPMPAPPAAPPPAPPPAPAPAPAPETEMPSFGDPKPKPVEEAVPEPASEEVTPDPASQPILYVENLGPSSYPGKRGLDGGSLALEPSFDGRQWPVMTRTGVGFSGWVWVDSGYAKIDRSNDFLGRDKLDREDPNRLQPNDLSKNTTRLLQQARAVVRVTPTYASGDFFIQGQAELVLNNCQSTGTTKCDQAGKGTVDTDDLWVRVGHWNIWDLKVGRFEGWELYHTGMGLDINTLERRGAQREATPGSTLDTPDIYTANYLHDRPTGMGIGYAALHFYAGPARMELLGEAGTDQATGSGNNIWGARPSLILDFRFLKLKYGVEYEKTTHGTTDTKPDPDDPNGEKMLKHASEYERVRTGQGGSIQFVFDPYVEFGVNAARTKVSEWDEKGSLKGEASYTQVSYGGFANLKVGPILRLRALNDLIIGGGYNYSWQTNEHRIGPDSDFSDHVQAFGAIQYRLSKRLFIKAVVAYANAQLQPTQKTPEQVKQDDGTWAKTDRWLSEAIFSNTMWSGRVRLMYLF